MSAGYGPVDIREEKCFLLRRSLRHQEAVTRRRLRLHLQQQQELVANEEVSGRSAGKSQWRGRKVLSGVNTYEESVLAPEYSGARV